MSTSVTIIMTPRNRTQLLAKTLDSIFAQRYPGLQIVVVEDRPSEASTEMLCLRHGLDYACRRRGDEREWMNPAALLNKGIQMARGEILIFQNAECKHESPNVIERLVQEVDADHTVSAVPLVQALNPQGVFESWLIHPTDSQRAGWVANFCQAVRREPVLEMRGFDESYHGYGFEDDDFEYRLKQSGIRFKYVSDILVSHQWHPQYHYVGTEKFSEQQFFARRQRIEIGESVVTNVGKEWGQI